MPTKMLVLILKKQIFNDSRPKFKQKKNERFKGLQSKNFYAKNAQQGEKKPGMYNLCWERLLW